MANRKKNKGGNSKLHGKYYNCPDYVLNAIGNAVKTYETLKKEEINKKQSQGRKYIYRIDEKLTRQVYNDLIIWMNNNKLVYETKKCARCKSTYELIIRVPEKPLTD